MDFMQNIHILPARPKKRCLFPKGDGTPEATGASKEKSGRKAAPLQVHTMSTDCQENGGGVQFLRIFSKSSEIVH